ncbi:MAG: hypothetical protein R2813_06210 [Flavobacteriales bacterium]
MKTAFEPTAPRSDLFPLFSLVIQLFDNAIGIWLNSILSSITAMLVFFFVNRIIQSLGLMSKLSNIPMLVMGLFYFLIPTGINSPVLWLILWLTVLFMRQCVAIISEDRSNVTIVNAAFICGVATLVYPFAAAGGFVLLAVVLLSGAADLRALMLTLVGFSLPLYIVWAIQYIFWPDTLRFWDVPFESYSWFSNQAIVSLGLFTLVVVSSVANNARILAVVTLRERRKWQLQLIMFAVATLAGLIGGISVFIVLGFIPAAIILSRTFASYPGKWFPETIFIALVFLVVITPLL